MLLKIIFFLTTNESNMGELTSTPDFVNDEGHQAHSYPDLLVNLGVVGLHGDPNIFYEALQHLKGKAVMNSYTALVLGFAGETRPFPVMVHPTPHTIPQGAPLVQHCSPQPLLRPTGAHLSTPSLGHPSTSHSSRPRALPACAGLRCHGTVTSQVATLH